MNELHILNELRFLRWFFCKTRVLDSIENSLLTGSDSVLGSDIILQLLLFQVHDEERLEHRVHKIEDNLCSKEPYLAQLFGTDSLSKDQENQIRYVFFVHLAKTIL